jgi:hypothetical protein
MAELEAVLAKLRASLKQRGAVGIGGLGRHFRIFDKDRHKDGPGSGLLDPEEFVHLVQVNQLGLDDASLNVLLRAFDRDGSGLIDYEEFLYRVRGSLSPAREKVVKEVFVTLDKIGARATPPPPLPRLFSRSSWATDRHCALARCESQAAVVATSRLRPCGPFTTRRSTQR